MAPRAAIRTLLGTDPDMIQIGFPKKNIFGSSSVDSPERKERWAVVACTDDTAAFGNVAATLVNIWFYQPTSLGRNYDSLQLACKRARELLDAAEHVPGGDGWILTAAKYIGGSADLFDPDFSALMKNVTFKVASRYLVSS